MKSLLVIALTLTLTLTLPAFAPRALAEGGGSPDPKSLGGTAAWVSEVEARLREAAGNEVVRKDVMREAREEAARRLRGAEFDWVVPILGVGEGGVTYRGKIYVVTALGAEGPVMLDPQAALVSAKDLRWAKTLRPGDLVRVRGKVKDVAVRGGRPFLIVEVEGNATAGPADPATSKKKKK